jgi:multidrug efflux system membrane fusion protein
MSDQPEARPTPDRAELMTHKPQRWLRPAALVGGVIAVLIVAGGLVTRGLASQALKTRILTDAVPTVSVIAPTLVSGEETLTLPGKVAAFNDAQIHARVSGYLKRWYTDIGAQVKAGQLLADIDTPEVDQQLAQAQANLATATANQKLAQVTAARWHSLLADDAVSHQEADEKASDLAAKSAAVNAAAAEVGRLRALETFKHITAPFDGIVTGRTTDIGALIAAGAPNDPGLFTVADVHRLRIYVNAPQSESADLRPGMAASLSVPEYPNQTFTATLASTNGAVSEQSGTMLVELQIDNPGGALKPGDYAQVSFALPAQAGVIRLPASAMMFRRGGMAVAVIGPNGRAALRPVTIAKDLGSTVEIAGGISSGDRVIDNPPDSIENGEPVHIASATMARNG